MSTFKKALALLLVIALTAAIAVSATLAYLADEDSDVNVMTLGNVEIEQHEYERVVNDDGTYKTDTIDNQTSYVLKEFEQGKPLMPAIIPNGGTVNGVKWDYDSIPVRMSQVGSHGSAGVFNTPNAQDKFVTVENTGKSDAYVRTFVAFEVGNAVIEDDTNYPNQRLISSEIRAETAEKNREGKQPWTIGFEGYVSINKNKYLVYELIYTGAMTNTGWKHKNGILPAGETTYPNLCQVYLASRATNEDVEALDGNNNGFYDILVLSQAVQAEGFTDAATALETAFPKGENNANIPTWFGDMKLPVQVKTVEELQAALDNAAPDVTNTIILADDFSGEIIAEQPTGKDVNVVIDGAGHKFDGTIKIKGNSTTAGSDSLVIRNINFETSTAEQVLIWSADTSNGSYWRYAKNVTIENCTFTATGAAEHTAVGIKFQQAYNINVVNCTATGMHSLLQAESCGSTVTVDGCKVVNGKNGVSLNNTMNAIVRNTTIESVGSGGYGIRHKGEVNGYSLTVDNCTVSAFVPVLIRNMVANSYTATFTGTNTLNENNSFDYQIVLSAGDWDSDNKAPSAPTGSYTLTGVSGFSVFEGN